MRLFVFEGILDLLHCQFGLCKQGGGESAVTSAVEKHRDQQFAIRVIKRIEGCSAGHSSRDRCRGRPSRLQEAQCFSGSSNEGWNRFRRLLPHSKERLQRI